MNRLALAPRYLPVVFANTREIEEGNNSTTYLTHCMKMMPGLTRLGDFLFWGDNSSLPLYLWRARAPLCGESLSFSATARRRGPIPMCTILIQCLPVVLSKVNFG